MSNNPQYWVAFMRMRAVTRDLGAMEMVPHNVRHPGPITREHWLLSLPDDIGMKCADDEWVERRYRLSDDMADKVGHKFIVAQMNMTPLCEDYVHFFKWQSRGVMAIMAGDDNCSLYPMKADVLARVCNWITDQQTRWCLNYHHDHKDHMHEGDAEVPTDFQGLTDLIAGIAATLKKPPKGGT